MKKRLLITSIVMMLVVAVALSTATYAWFTANTSVSAASITMKASTNTQAALGISWTDGNYGSSISPVITNYASDETFVFSPVTPASLSTSGTITEPTVAFATQTAKSTSTGFVFNGAGVEATHAAYRWTNETQSSFFVKNLSPSNPLVGNLTLTAEITGQGAELIRVGVFKYNANSGKYELKAVLANTVDQYVAVATNETFAANTAYYKVVLGQYVLATPGETTQNVTDGVADYVVGTSPSVANTFFKPVMNSTAVTGTAAADVTYYISNGAGGYRIAKAGTTDEVTAGTADYTIDAAVTADTLYVPAKTHATAVYGTIGTEAPAVINVNDLSKFECAESVNLETNLAADTAIEVVIVAWMDGAALGDAEGGRAASISLTFDVQ